MLRQHLKGDGKNWSPRHGYADYVTATKVVAEVEVLVAISCPAFDSTAEQTSHLNLLTVEISPVFWSCEFL